MDKNFRELLKKEYVVFDGAMGTMLQAAGMKMGETPEVLSITQPQLLVGIHEKYLRAGADVIYANTFGANRYKLEECGKHLIKVDRYFASSKICSLCGHKKKELALSDRMYVCECGNKMDRDVNAAVNIREEGKRIYKECA